MSDELQAKIRQAIQLLEPAMLQVTEAQFEGAGYSVTSGAWLGVRLPGLDSIQPYDGATKVTKTKPGDRYIMMVLKVEDDETISQQPGTIGDQRETEVPASDQASPAPAHKDVSIAQKLHKDGWFFNRKMWAAMDAMGLYTQAEHKAWVESIECVYSAVKGMMRSWVDADAFIGKEVWPDLITNSTDWVDRLDPGGQVVAHHARAPGDGTGMKPWDFQIVPVDSILHTEGIHKHQNREVRQALLDIASGLTAYRMKWAMKRCLKLESLSELTEDKFNEFKQLMMGGVHDSERG